MRRSPLEPLLFHYTRRETAIEKLFLNGSIRMGPLNLTNDPEESALGSFGVATNGMSDEEMFAVMETCHSISTTPVRLACFTEEARNEHGQRIGLHGYDHGRMWAQYAGVNSGVAIAFSKERLLASTNAHFAGRKGRLLHGPVTYVDKIESSTAPYFMVDHEEIKTLGLVSYARKKRDEYAKERYLRKTIDWQGEQEYRFVWIDDDDNYAKDGECIPIADSVRSICLGTHFPIPYRSIIKEICDAFHMDVYRVTHEAGVRQRIPINWV